MCCSTACKRKATSGQSAGSRVSLLRAKLAKHEQTRQRQQRHEGRFGNHLVATGELTEGPVDGAERAGAFELVLGAKAVRDTRPIENEDVVHKQFADPAV